MQVTLAGIVQVKAVEYDTTDQIREDPHGTLLAQNTIGVLHDHFLTYYLDLDVDGEANSFVKANLVTKRTAENTSPRKSNRTVEKEMAKTESDARIHLGLAPSELLVENRVKKTKIGNAVSYRLVS